MDSVKYNSPPEETWLTVGETGRTLQFSPGHVATLIQQGKLVAKDLGCASKHRYRVQLASVHAYRDAMAGLPQAMVCNGDFYFEVPKDMPLPVRGRGIRDHAYWTRYQEFLKGCARRGSYIVVIAAHKNASHDHVSQAQKPSEDVNLMRHHHEKVHARVISFGPEKYRAKPTRRKS
jgi:hypothetical protein